MAHRGAGVVSWKTPPAMASPIVPNPSGQETGNSRPSFLFRSEPLMTQPETWTVGRLLTWTADYLKKSGSPSPRLDAEVLLAAARKCERISLYTAFEEIVPDDVRSAFRDLVKRRAAGTPVAYLVGKKEFYSLSFQVTPDVLIPRPETEHLVVAALDLLARISAESTPRVVDVGTGSG